MKKIYALTIFFFCFGFTFSQTRTQTVLKWAGGIKQISKVTQESNTNSYYLFLFRNSKYTELVDYQSVIIGDFTDYQTFVETLDSLISKVEITKGEIINYSIGNIKNVTLSMLMGKSMITIYDNDMLGYCFIGVADVKKLKTLTE